MKPHNLARLALIVTATLLVCQIFVSTIIFLVCIPGALEGRFDMHRTMQLVIGRSPFILLAGAFFGAWLLRSRRMQILMLAIYLLLGLFACGIGLLTWSYTGSIGTLIAYPLTLLVSVLALVTIYRTQNVEQTGAVNPHAFGTFGIPPAEQARMPKASGDT